MHCRRREGVCMVGEEHVGRPSLPCPTSWLILGRGGRPRTSTTLHRGGIPRQPRGCDAAAAPWPPSSPGTPPPTAAPSPFHPQKDSRGLCSVEPACLAERARGGACSSSWAAAVRPQRAAWCRAVILVQSGHPSNILTNFREGRSPLVLPQRCTREESRGSPGAAGRGWGWGGHAPRSSCSSSCDACG